MIVGRAVYSQRLHLVLRKKTDLQPRSADERACFGLERSGNELRKRRLAVPVDAEKRDPIIIVDAEAERAPVEPRVFQRIHLRYQIAGRGLDPRQVQRAVKLSKEKYCSATIMLAQSAEITYEVRLVDGDRIDADAAAQPSSNPAAGTDASQLATSNPASA